MVSLLTLLNKLVPQNSNATEALINTNEIRKTINSKINNLYKITFFEFVNENLNQLLSCFLLIDCRILPIINKTDLNRYYFNKEELESYKSKLIKILEDESILLEDNYIFNRKKLISLVMANNYNNELILFLAYYYNVNIIIYYDDINIFKLYYPESSYDTSKNCIFLKYLEDYYTNIYSYQLLYENNTFVISGDNFIIHNKDLLYPIGFEENKQFIISDSLKSIKDDNLLDFNETDFIDDESYNCENKLNSLPVSYYNDYIKYILKKYKFKDYRLFKYYK